MSASVIKVEHLTRKLAGEVPITLVNDVSLQVDTGEFLAITGPSGSGKSSLLYLLGLLDTPTMGSIWIENEDISHYTEEQLASIRLRKLGFIFQFHFLLPEFTALENVMLPMQRLGHLTAEEIFRRASGLLEELGLGSQMNKLPKQLSGGQSQRVAIARALANEPVVILADEPTGNLDSAASQNVQSLLKEIAHHYQRTVIVVTHDTNFAATTDRQVVLVDGHLQ
ncbi:ABC transporter ATP binding protein [Legionella quinlivanii]|uniref:ABC transporter ATP binding protein n=1 Tax=Legionella quinlivanii TaxID=45073 RepID=A0A0W0Y5Y7_9GAMM|nr:ABC transporter ATP-binding protein [Legionella quinlivanii]KTD52086.1 ABC transporter ATP binding protein [Legionella quinlivanii]MCW8452350.1 ABC transporter ATP-binding protein [Legionella quinlivanii]SEF89727.1 lipoprotein-releasing system ATP-binding protein [Legionella quinlivanii DSM 21216]STY12418.1 ABC transporter ATP binding protein [Legionella quinlivanii]